MEIYGREIGLLFSVGAKYKIGTIPADADNFTRTVKTAVYMSEAYEASRKFAGEKPGKPLTEEEVLSLTDDTFVQLCEAVSDAFTVGQHVTVEAEPGKKKEASS